MNRAYSVLHVKAVDEDQRVIRGTATTPSPDRMGDIVEPLGVRFKNPLALLHQHDSDRPVGTVKFDPPTKDGITFEARLPVIAEAGPLKDRVDTAWGEVKAGLVRAVSIGFRALEYAFIEGTGGIRFTETEVLELSLVSVPANADAVISTIKSIDRPLLAASGKEPQEADRPARPGVTGKTDRAARPVRIHSETRSQKMKTAEQIASFEATRETKAARMSAIMEESATKGETLDAEQSEEYDTLKAELKAIDDHIARLRDHEAIKAASAKPIEKKDGETPAAASAARSSIVIRQSEPEPGIRFARYVKCLGLAHKTHRDPVAIAMETYGERDPKTVENVKAAVIASNTTTDAALIGNEGGWADFVDYLRPRTIIGRFGQNGIPALTRIPFRVPLITEATESAAYWVGEGKPKPLTKASWSRTEMTPLKVANISVATMEQLRDSSPSGEMLIRDSLVKAIAKAMDQAFIDPANSGAAGSKPASITDSLSGNSFASGGQDIEAIYEDARTAIGKFVTANNPLLSGVWIMSASTALALSMLRNALGAAEFPGLTMNGGTFFGLPVLTSQYVGNYVALVNAEDIYLGDEGGVTVSMSTEASLQMMDNPTNDVISSTPVATDLVSLWQTNSVGFLAERTVNWMRRRSTAVALVTAVTWGVGAT